MDPLVTSSLISAGSNILGGLFGGDKGPGLSEQLHIQKRAERQRTWEYPSWVVKGAKMAGLHPLYVMGNVPQYSPTISASGPDTRMGDAIASAGQDLSRAYHANSTKDERAAQRILLDQQIKRGELENQKLASEIAVTNQQITPALPSFNDQFMLPGQGNSTPVNSEIVVSAPGEPARQSGVINDYQYVKTKDGYTLVPSEQMKNRMEDDLISTMMWHTRNRVIAPPPPKDGWYWNPLIQQYQPNPFSREGRKYISW